MVEIDPRDKYAAGALSNYHRPLLEPLADPRHKWDLVVLQSYRDDMEGGAIEVRRIRAEVCRVGEGPRRSLRTNDR
ncbi:MAG: hypothetical protein QM775_10415 [Pirellulales bacterium]